MREPRRAGVFTHRFILGTQAGLCGVALLLGLTAVAEAQTPRLMTLSEAVADQRVDPILGLYLHRAAAGPVDLASTPSALAPGESQIDALANSGRIDLSPATPVSLLIEGEASRASLEAVGALVGTVAGDVITATAPLSLVPAILGVSGVRYVRAAGMVTPALNISVPETEADILWAGSPPNYTTASITGKGIVVGLVDSGVDPRPSDFKDATGKTRFKSVWDQSGTGIPPTGFAYGLEYTPTQIDNNLIDALRDDQGHGTHVLGVAAGNGQSTGNTLPAWRYVGVAPRADIIAVKSLLTESYVIDAVNYVFQRAAGKPAVVNLSLSIAKGAHDGTYAFDRALSALTGQGKIITAAAGNAGLDNGHARLDLASGASGDASFTIPTYTPSITFTELLYIEGWHDATAAFDIKLISPTGIQSTVVTPGLSSGFIQTADGTISIQNGINTNQLGAKQITVMVALGNAGTPRPKPGTWKINVKRRSGTTSGLSHWWVTDYRFATTVLPAFTGSSVDTSTTVMSPATGDSIISTGAYTTKTSWTNIGGSTSRYPGYPPLDRLADFSSRGPRRDGVQRPDIVAPGYGVMSTMPTTGSISSVFKDPDGKHFMLKGTSIANGHTTGGVALLLEQRPVSAPSTIRALLRKLARSDPYTGTTPNGKYGYGKLDVSVLGQPTTDVGDITAPGLAFRSLFPNPSSESATFEFDVASLPGGSESSTPVGVRIIDVRGREVAHVAGAAALGIQRLTWDGRMNSGAKAPSGIYFARLEVGDTKLQRKFVRVLD